MIEFSIDKLRGIMAEKKISQVDIADRLNISLQAVSNKFTGKTEFTFKELKELSKMLCVEFVIKGWE